MRYIFSALHNDPALELSIIPHFHKATSDSEIKAKVHSAWHIPITGTGGQEGVGLVHEPDARHAVPKGLNRQS